jgi:atypical dual specificity phosphatase
VEYLKSRNVCGVINLCYEYSGPLSEYSQHQIQHLHLPTLDVHDPTLAHMKQAVDFINTLLLPSGAEEREEVDESSIPLAHNASALEKQPGKKVIFIHCKGGRGRAVTTCMCYLLSRGFSIQQSFDQIKSCRPVASEGVLYSTVLKEFEKWSKLERHSPSN